MDTLGAARIDCRQSAFQRVASRVAANVLSAARSTAKNEYAGIVERRPGVRKSAEYHLSEAIQELRTIIEALGFWGARWMRDRLTGED